jgi:hypothetical protein
MTINQGNIPPVRTSVLISLLLVATFLIADLFLEWQSIRDATLFFFVQPTPLGRGRFGGAAFHVRRPEKKVSIWRTLSCFV